MFNTEAHARLANKLVRNIRDRARIYWEIGYQIVLEVPGDENLTADYRDRLAAVYGNKPFNLMRRFAELAKSSVEATEVINQYSSWGDIRKNYLVGREPGEQQSVERKFREKEREAFRNQNTEPPTGKPKPATGPTDLRGFNVDSSVVRVVAERLGFPYQEALTSIKRAIASDPEWLASVIVARLQRNPNLYS